MAIGVSLWPGQEIGGQFQKGDWPLTCPPGFSSFPGEEGARQLTNVSGELSHAAFSVGASCCHT